MILIHCITVLFPVLDVALNLVKCSCHQTSDPLNAGLNVTHGYQQDDTNEDDKEADDDGCDDEEDSDTGADTDADVGYYLYTACS